MAASSDRPNATARQAGDETADEMVEVIDDDNRVVGTVTRREMRRRNLPHRSVAIVVRSSSGDVLIHQRAPNKDLFPSFWDCVAGGVVGVGERDDAAARRELDEELGIGSAELTYMCHARYDDDASREWCAIYTAHHDGPFAFTDGEIVAARWVSVEELSAVIDGDDFMPGSRALAHRFLLRPTMHDVESAPSHPLLETVKPLLDAIGASLVPADQAEVADVPLVWDREVVGAVRLPPLYGALDRLIAVVEAELGGPLPSLSRDDKQRAVRMLDERGAFILRRAVEDVADAMGVSRITIYNYLNAIHR